MRIQHNIMAMNAYRNYNTNTKALSGNLEKLSSGYKINRAGDDAAGLAISEKMRAQITGLDAAQKNVKDGISLVKTAEGAMQEIQDMLNRMDYLATQSANGTYQDEVDRENLQKEVNALKTEINRIADSANFNGIKLLDGSQAAKGGSAATSVGKIEGVNTIDIDPTKGQYGTNAAVTQLANTKGDTAQITVSLTDGNGNATKEVTVNLTCIDATKKTWVDDDGNEYTLGTADAANTAAMYVSALSKNADIKDKFTVSVGDGNTEAVANGIDFVAKEGGADATQVSAVNITRNKSGTVEVDKAGVTSTPGEDAYTTIDITKLKIYEGSDATPANNGTNKLERATFTVNGKKFAVVDRTALDDEMKAELKAAGVDHFLDVTSNKWAEADENDLLDAAHKISMETGLTTELGITTEGANNTFAKDESKTGADGATIAVKAGASKVGNGGLTLQIGDTADSFNQMKVVIGDMHTKAMGIANVDIGDQDGAAAAIQTIKDAINYVSSVRGDLGAVQNRLEHTGNNLSVMAENIQDAESTIRDTDVANEMMSYVKNNILVQSAQAMLAQANQVPQGVLQLLG